jgi:hypothetical protein
MRASGKYWALLLLALAAPDVRAQQACDLFADAPKSFPMIACEFLRGCPRWNLLDGYPPIVRVEPLRTHVVRRPAVCFGRRCVTVQDETVDFVYELDLPQPLPKWSPEIVQGLRPMAHGGPWIDYFPAKIQSLDDVAYSALDHFCAADGYRRNEFPYSHTLASPASPMTWPFSPNSLGGQCIRAVLTWEESGCYVQFPSGPQLFVRGTPLTDEDKRILLLAADDSFSLPFQFNGPDSIKYPDGTLPVQYHQRPRAVLLQFFSLSMEFNF